MAIDDFDNDPLLLARRIDILFEVAKTQTEIMREILRALSEVRTKTTLVLELMLDEAEAECEACGSGGDDSEGRIQ